MASLLGKTHRVFLTVLLTALAATPLLAQDGSVAGTIEDEATGSPLGTVLVEVVNADGSVVVGFMQTNSRNAAKWVNGVQEFLCPDPSFGIHSFSIVIAGGEQLRVPLEPVSDLIDRLDEVVRFAWPRPKMLIASFPHNPTTVCVDLGFMSRLVDFCREYDLILLHDLAYAEICFDGYTPPSVLQVPGATDVAIEFTSLSKSHSMAGWRVGFAAGNREMIAALARVKSYVDYGTFQPIQIAAIVALDGPQDCVEENVRVYHARRDALCDGLGQAGPTPGWKIDKPLGTMFVWAPLPEPFRELGSLEFSKRLLEEAEVAVSPGIGFGPSGEGFVRFALVENTHRIRQAVRNIRRFLRNA